MCKTCSGSGDNCKSCNNGFGLSEVSTGKYTCKEGVINPPTEACGIENCQTCPDDSNFCSICAENYCGTNFGNCVYCEGSEDTYSYFERTEIYFSIRQASELKNGYFYIAFSEPQWFLAISNSHIEGVTKEFTLEFQGYKKGVHFEYQLEFNPKKLRIDANVDYYKEIEPTLLVARVSRKNIISGVQSKQLAHTESSI